MVVLAAVLILVALGVWLFCIFEVLSTDEDEVRRLPKFAWLVIAIFGFEVGAAAWLLLGRPHGLIGARLVSWPPEFLLATDGANDEGSPPAPLGPDDDPEFLRSLDRRMRGDEP